MFLTHNRILCNQNCTNWKESIHIACELLLKDQLITPLYTQAIINTVHQHGPYFNITPKIILAHARPDEGALKNGVSYISLKNEIDFIGYPIKFVFASSAIDSYEHIKLIQLLSEVLDTKNIYEILEFNPYILLKNL
ncbi:MAG: PTS sugar transporter subunit IIA [Brevinema sp.]